VAEVGLLDQVVKCLSQCSFAGGCIAV
jgi:hypothetical protein